MRLFEVFAFKRRHCLNPLSWVWRDRNIEQGSKAFIQAVGSNNDGLVSEEDYKKSIHPYLIRSHILSETCCQPKSMSEELQNFSSFNGTAAQFKDINAFFREVDTDTDGKISELELQAWILNNMTCQSFMKRMFSNAQSIDEGVTRFISQADLDGDRCITEEEAIHYFRSNGVGIKPDGSLIKDPSWPIP